MFKLENPELFQQIVSRAIETVQKRWALNEAHQKSVINAISKAVIRIREQGEFMHYDAEADRFLIWSQSSNLVYELGPDGHHGCLAELNGSVCWHKVAKRLIALYNVAMLGAFCSPETGARAEAAGISRKSILEALELKDMPYMQPGETRRREKIGGVWL